MKIENNLISSSSTLTLLVDDLSEERDREQNISSLQTANHHRSRMYRTFLSYFQGSFETIHGKRRGIVWRFDVAINHHPLQCHNGDMSPFVYGVNLWNASLLCYCTVFCLSFFLLHSITTVNMWCIKASKGVSL